MYVRPRPVCRRRLHDAGYGPVSVSGAQLVDRLRRGPQRRYGGLPGGAAGSSEQRPAGSTGQCPSACLQCGRFVLLLS